MADKPHHEPVVGRHKPPTMPPDHMRGWNDAVQDALEHIGREKGTYDVTVELSARVEVENPGHVIEYIAKIT